MKMIVYSEEMEDNLIAFFGKVFKDNKRSLDLDKKDKDIADIENNYMKTGNFWCLVKDNNICGTIGIRKVENFFEIRRFFIYNKYQSIGYGKKMISTAIDYIISIGGTHIKIATMKEGHAIKSILDTYGFIPTTRYNNSSADNFFELTLTQKNTFNYYYKKLEDNFANTLILNPTENIPSYFREGYDTSYFEGLYISERLKDVNDKVIFSGRNDYIHFFEFIKDEWKKELSAFDVDLKTLSGLNAHLIFFLCVLTPKDRIMVLPEICGGHFSTEQILKNIGLNTYQMIPDLENHCVDIEKTKSLIKSENINYIFVDRSEGLYYEDFSWLKEFNDCYKIFDASQYLSLILTGNYPNPFNMGFDLILSTLHKNYPGPQKGMLATKKEDAVWNKYLKNAKTYISNTHPLSIVNSLFPLLDKGSLDNYCNISTTCVQLLETLLIKGKVPIIEKNQSLTPTHHIWILCETAQESYQYYLDLEQLGLLANYRLLPYNLGYGLRIGLNAAVLDGLKESHISELARIMILAYESGANPELQRGSKGLIDKIKNPTA